MGEMAKGEHVANNNVCFLFALMVIWASLFNSAAGAVFEAMS